MKSDGRSLPHSAPAVRASRKAARKRRLNAPDPEKLLRLAQQLYAHALTLQEVIRNGGQVTYEVLRPKYDRQAAQQFEIFHPTLESPSHESPSHDRTKRLRKRVVASCK